jgi:hypothetical protein
VHGPSDRDSSLDDGNARERDDLVAPRVEARRLQVDDRVGGRELETRAASGSVSYSSLARVYAGLGDFNRAFHWLERTFEAQPSALLVLGVDPTFDPLRSDHRFVELLRKMGLASSTVRRREP